MKIDSFSIIGFVAAFFTTASTLPQLLKTIKLKKTDELSLMMYVCLTIGVFLWLLYGILSKNPPLIFANTIAFILNAIVLVLKIKYDRSR